ncbi:DUF87 domain-containing protein [Mycobacteroides abscessus]|uniref:ATP-binding protein n=1 Tax=Mycobacteroides abscessus TaxID=36809 RepID=UPI0009296674|nr:DUF87 domain-containing protein [Mycobacteroides abscessus]UEA49303.1 DUF87 domain-containing protein [Mycobacteroides abscessus subsp. abscessus]UEA54891.1 DUF87 domain-containing protein [Mycobacteroides abscessus]SHR17690.1 Type IV secretory pathway, VirB4 components [Mycobacteroides abscessus subsp. bolletii]SHS70059.1 Type IV secretory pathway, VirB4 components [Mycobacteroides abscessus subsp. bolletii]SHS90573.1 Type IV secretory pathway, VirB4 components [Mycobacteroides abscessus s
MTIFPNGRKIGTFYGFSDGGLAPSAELVFRHSQDFQATPVNGMPVLVRLDDDDQALLLRITRLQPGGRLASSIGEEYAMRSIRDEHDALPEDVLESFLSYRVNARPLGVLREVNGKPIFVASHRRIPPFGAAVAFPDDDLFRVIMAADPNSKGAEIGFTALGEFVWGTGDDRFTALEWMVPKSPLTIPKFDIEHLLARRSFVLAKAGYGKSNLVRFLFSELYRTTPTVKRDNGQPAAVGTIIGDLDGEYSWPDSNGVPGLVDIPHLRDKVVIFTDKTPPSGAYGSFVAGPVKIDIRKVPPRKIMKLTIPPDRQSQANIAKITGLNLEKWGALVDLVDPANNHSEADIDAELGKILTLTKAAEETQRGAARWNVHHAIRQLHDPNSMTLDLLLHALSEGKLCVVDLSQLRGAAQAFLGLVLSHIFDHNMEQHTAANSTAIPVIAVIEEAQNVLNTSGGPTTQPFVEFAKEGRKFNCAVMAITQQPGSIDTEIISQGDNFFAFHLLSEGDLTALKKANAHFSEDILSSLLNEPIVGSGYFWSGHSDKKYPIPFRPFDLKALYGQSLLDPSRERSAAIATYANTDLRKYERSLWASADADKSALHEAIEALKNDTAFHEKVNSEGLDGGWGHVLILIKRYAPEGVNDDWAKNHVSAVLTAVLGKQGQDWDYSRDTKLLRRLGKQT